MTEETLSTGKKGQRPEAIAKRQAEEQARKLARHGDKEPRDKGDSL